MSLEIACLSLKNNYGVSMCLVSLLGRLQDVFFLTDCQETWMTSQKITKKRRPIFTAYFRLDAPREEIEK